MAYPSTIVVICTVTHVCKTTKLSHFQAFKTIHTTDRYTQNPHSTLIIYQHVYIAKCLFDFLEILKHSLQNFQENRKYMFTVCFTQCNSI